MKIKKFFAIILSFAMLFCLCACGGESDTAPNNQSTIEEYKNAAPKFKVTVTDTDGNAVEGVILQIRKDTQITARTNKMGVATFNLYVTDGYKLSVVHCPDGYEYNGDETIHIMPGSFNCSIQITKK